MTTTSFFKIEDKLKDKYGYHAWKMILDLTLEENDSMDYVRGRIAEPPSSAFIVFQTKYKKGETKSKKIIVHLFISLWVHIFLIWKHIRRCMKEWLGCSKWTMQIKFSFSITSWKTSIWIEDNPSYITSWGSPRSRMIFYLLEKSLVIENSLLLHLGTLEEIGMCSTLPLLIMTGFHDMRNYWLDVLKKK